MTPKDILSEYRLCISRIRRERDIIQETIRTARGNRRKYHTVVVSDGPRHVLRRPRTAFFK